MTELNKRELLFCYERQLGVIQQKLDILRQLGPLGDEESALLRGEVLSMHVWPAPGSTPSLKQPALQALGRFSASAHTTSDEMMTDFELLRQAVLQLPD